MSQWKTPRAIQLKWPKQYRIIPSVYPPIDFFEKYLDADEMAAAWYLESLTNDRLRDRTGDISLVRPEDRVAGPGSTPVMAAFTHIGEASRFSDGSYGVYYASIELETAIHETVYRREIFLRRTHEPPCHIDMRVYEGKVLKPMHNLRTKAYSPLHDPDDYSAAQAFASHLRIKGSWGMVYNSVRHKGGECIAALCPPAVSIPRQAQHLAYIWDSERIVSVYRKSDLIIQF
jgi:hypothetical protein